MNITNPKIELISYVKCKKCDVRISLDTNKRVLPCACKTISVDGNGKYFRILGNKNDYEIVNA